MYEIRLTAPAQKDLDRLDKKIFQNLIEKIRTLADNPRPFGSIKLSREEIYRLRCGKYRVL